jgi:adenylyltransferase/sulfurtransferase
MLSREEYDRYSRHLLLPEVGEAGQARLKSSAVLLVGAGGLGSPLALYLAAAGVGRIGIVDFDVVDVTNLQRQVLYGTCDVGRPKAEAARTRLHDLNPHVQVDVHPIRLTRSQALDLVAQYDLVADGSDNFATRYLVNDACVLTGRPHVYGSVHRFEGQVSVLGMPEGPCYRCLFPDPPPPTLVPSCAEAGVLGVLPGLVGMVQATEVIKYCCGLGELLVGRMLLIDALAMSFRTHRLRRDPACPVCGPHPTIRELVDYEALCGTPAPLPIAAITADDLQARLERSECLCLLDVRRPDEYARSNLGGRLVPVEELAARIAEVADWQHEDVVVLCRSGVRSAHAVALLQQAGFTRARSLTGGLMAWKALVPDFPLP